ncbi:hypothetical protein like AT3G49190 [Hibiscus trionum]|uniref:Diacylglycerol O-acyltransferase n=1 Tax=Hibiscus trionum TaxID=183268 RepID=A0A9W7JF70_HIBTR|nr:hypothetical protein like AT3G49190 [Hibiscus trionum]
MGMEHLDCNDLRSRTHLGLKQIKVRKEREVEVEEEEEALSPMARMFHEPESNVYVILIVGFKNPIHPHTFKANLVETIVKHPRFSSVQVADGGEMKWVKTKVDIDQHVKVPLVDQDMVSSDKFVEDYVASLSKTQISMSIPMWDCHILNVKTSDAESTLVIRVHHSLGDGTSLMSLLISCSDTLPSFPMMKKPRSTGTGWFSNWFRRCWSVLLLTWNTLVDICMCVATTYFLKDTETPLKAPSRSVASTCRRIVRRTFCFDDVKSVKNATNTTVNDVMLAITQAGLSRYLNRKYGKAKSENGEARVWESNLPNRIRLTATLFINMRLSPGIYALEEMVKKNSKAEWGNKIGYVVFPLKIALKDNPLDYLKDAKATMDRKKATLEAKFRLFMAKVFVKLYPAKVASFPSTTLWFSNVAGPQDQISIFGNQVSSIAPSLYGQPVALTIHIISYAKKIAVVLSVDENIISDPYELCDDIEEALKLIKNMAIGVIN